MPFSAHCAIVVETKEVSIVKNIILAALPLALLAACNDAATAASEPVKIAEMSACEAVSVISIPFESLKTGNVVMGEDELPDSFTTDAAPFGQTCTYGKMGGWNEGDPDTYVFRCPVFAAGTFDFDENKAKAEAAYADAKATLDECLGAEWAANTDVATSGEEFDESIIYERAEDRERSETANFYMYPIMLQKDYNASPPSRGGTWGWLVDVAFQQQHMPKSEEE